MQRIWPTDPSDGANDSPGDAVANHLRADRVVNDRPWVMANMVASIDGAATRAGRSGSLAGPGDRVIFHALREVPDAILAGAATVRTERYRPPKPRPDGVRPRLVIVSGTLHLPADLPCFEVEDPAERPIVLTGADSPVEERERLGDVAEVLVAGDLGVEPRAALAALADRQIGVVLCEGGPRLLGQFVAKGLVDEWYLTIGAVAVLGTSSRITHLDTDVEAQFRLRSVLHDGDDLFLAYAAVRPTNSAGIRTS